MTLKKFRSVSLHELYAGGREPTIDLYVYTTTNNPNGAEEGTDGRYIGTADSYSLAADLLAAAEGAAKAIYGSQGHLEIGLCVDADALLKGACKHLLWAKKQKGHVSDELAAIWLEDAIEGVRFALGGKA